MRYHLFQKFFGKMVKIKETSFLSIRGMYLSCHGCMPGTCNAIFWTFSSNIIAVYSSLSQADAQYLI